MNPEGIFSLTLASITFIMTVIWGGPLLEILRRLRIGKQIRVDGPQTHFSKLGTPTMGGLLVIAPVLVITAVLNLVSLVKVVTGPSILLPLSVLIGFAVLGIWDDWYGLRNVRSGEGIRARYKFFVQVIIALGAVLVLYYGFDIHSVALPGFPRKVDIGLLYIPIGVLIIVGTSNAVNITDGLDGMAGLVLVTNFMAFGFVALLQEQVFLVRFCFTLVGALFAFLWFNVHPAQLFMGDTGSLSLGALLGVVALMTGQWLLLPIIAIVPLAETLSVAIQVLYFKWSGGKRVFRMAPLHHHFELLGWSETQVVQRFWLVSILSGMIGVALALL
ncbi:MAG TPA: phospho-N-acetylmuramoyl-pentapeptide-transferase [Chloroflexi bacterium]|nr:phospho-N-acetylmuramoyl-pentapeptide-transferase [Chloroflexota bacterium]|tara:strand:+ start:3610 stop:4602 length:993 start_codon:yes stop_codon:yes gene_type:complete